MLFSSFMFIFFFLPITVLINYLFLKHIKIQNLLLMLFSLAFYYWGEKDHIFIMLACILVNYMFGILIGTSSNKSLKKTYLILDIIISISLLFYFKYFNFFMENVNGVFNLNTEFKKVFLPIGISFYTFHALSYVIDVYWDIIKPEKNFVTFTCYVSLFPQLVAGPIVRYRDIYKSFYCRYITTTGIRNGISRFCFGLGKKVLIADTVAVIADKVFSLPHTDLTFSTAWLGIIAYTIQIYFDFSGYSDMAIGIGLMLGFKYKENFNFPYSALSMQDFWRRWHISLSSWFRDYVYIPLGGNRNTQVRTFLNLLAVFLLCGLWHGANYTFIAWGLFHGIFLILERTKFGSFIENLPNVVRRFYVILTVILSWVLFRVEHISDSFYYYKTLFSPTNFSIFNLSGEMNAIVITAYIVGIALSLGLNPYIKNKIISNAKFIIPTYKNIRTVAAIVVLALSLLPLSSNSYSPFLYFRF